MELNNFGRETILIVEDTEMIRVLMAAQLKNAGYEVVQAGSGEEAIELFERFPIDLILMDVMLPGMNGYATVHAIRHLATEWIPIIFVSATACDDSVVTAMHVVGDDYLFKPVNFEILHSKIETQLMFRKSAKQNELIAIYKEQIDAVPEIFEHFIQNFHVQNKVNDSLVRIHVPSTCLSDVVVSVARTPDNRLHVLLANGLGKGLQPMLTGIAISHPFYQMTALGCDLSSIVLEINSQLLACFKSPQFVSAVLLSLDVGSRTIQVRNGSNATVLFIDAKSKQIAHKFTSEHLPLGASNLAEFDNSVESYTYPIAGHLLLGIEGVASNIRALSLNLTSLLEQMAIEGEDELFESIINEMRKVGVADSAALISVDCQ